jgi:hypothetical protein
MLRQARTVLEEALTDHLKRKSVGARGGVATRTAGSFKVSRRQIERILPDEPGLPGSS